MRILYVTTISLTINTFFKPHIQMLVEEGHQVDIACNDTDLPIDPLYYDLGCKIHRVDFSRTPICLDNVKAFSQLSQIVEKGCYDIVHCHTPNASFITRLVCGKFRKKRNLKVFYTAHGFHFYKGAPLLNWLVFYPAEKFCSLFTDKLITINKEDYELAKKKFKAKEVHYVPGVGLDLSNFQNIHVDRATKRMEIGVPEDAFMLFSVGELNENKNHQIVIQALTKLNNPKVHYVIAGEGDKREYLLNLSSELKVLSQVHLLGYRKDVAELFAISDVFCFPSYREGLSVSLMEAIASGVPVICSAIRGNVDLVDENSEVLFNPFNVGECFEALRKMLNTDLEKIAKENKKHIIKFSLKSILGKMHEIYMFSAGDKSE